MLTRIGAQIPGVEIREQDKTIRMANAFAQIKSSTDPHSLRGVALHDAILDEAAYQDEIVWTEAVRPTLSDYQGTAIFLSTPAGRNWFWRLWNRGIGSDDESIAAFHYPTSANPYIAHSEIEAARSQMPERKFRQEYLAEFVDDGAGLFKIVHGGELEPHKHGCLYVAGVDLARTTDYTVMVILRVPASGARQVVFMERFNNRSWEYQRCRIAGLVREWGCRAIVDSTGVGDPIVEDLERAVPGVTGYKFTGQSKPDLIERLMLATERGEVQWPDTLTTMTQEMQAYEARAGAAGNVKYNAPDGEHDDCVIALALAVECARQYGHQMYSSPQEFKRTWNRLMP